MSSRSRRSQTSNDIRRGVAALWVLGLIVMAASVTAFAESYNGLQKWAEQHRVTGVWADIWPLQVDAFIAAGELTLLLSALYLWPVRVRVLAWTVSLTGLGVSVTCNAGHVGNRASIADHLTASLPPVAAIAGLVIALSVIKQVTLMDRLVTEEGARGATTAPGGTSAAPGTEPMPGAEPMPSAGAMPGAETVPDAVHTQPVPGTEYMTGVDPQAGAAVPAGAEPVAVEVPLQVNGFEHPTLIGASPHLNGAPAEPPLDPLRRRYEELLGESS